MMEIWYQLFDDVYAYMKEHPTKPCAAGHICPGEWQCCKITEGEARAVVALPYEDRWQKFSLQEDEQGQTCPSCMRINKGIMCTLYPVIPIVWPGGEPAIQLYLDCEAFTFAPESYIPIVELASFINDRLYEDYPELRASWLLEVGGMVAASSGRPVLTFGYDDAIAFLKAPTTPQIVQTLLAGCKEARKMNDAGAAGHPVRLNVLP